MCLVRELEQRKASRFSNLYTLNSSLNYIFEKKSLTKLADVTRDIEKWRLECAERSTQERIETRGRATSLKSVGRLVRWYHTIRDT
jgi:hypothetical protein